MTVPRPRLYFLDNLRIFGTAMVIAHHAAQPYGPTGPAWPYGEPVRAEVLGAFFTVNRSFGMSLFFLIAGYFTALSFDRTRPRQFVQSRLVRLVPPVIGMAVVMTAIALQGARNGETATLWPVNVGHLWFVQHLLIYSLGYVLWRRLRPVPPGPAANPLPPPGALAVIAAGLGLSAVLYLVRLIYPIDVVSFPLGFIYVAWADVPRDLALFWIGLAAYRHDWLSRFPTRDGLRWLMVGVILAGLVAAMELGLAELLGLTEPMGAVLEALWEPLFCFSMCIGLTVLFRERANVTSRLLRRLSDAQYETYLVHVFVVLGIQVALAGWAAPPLVKFAVVTLTGLPLSFLVGGVLHRALSV